jgi:hypothetical protein
MTMVLLARRLVVGRAGGGEDMMGRLLVGWEAPGRSGLAFASRREFDRETRNTFSLRLSSMRLALSR